jgi:hypothetical protein
VSWLIAGQAPEIHDDDLVGCLRLAINLWVERRHHVEADAGQCEELGPEFAGEHRVSVAHDGPGHTVQPDDVVKKSPGNQSCGVQMPKHDEVRVFG